MHYYKTTFLICLALLLSSCQLDNYPIPKQTLKVTVIDKTTGEPIETEYSGIRGTLLELSYSENPEPLYIWSRPNGTLTHTKLFEGKYKIEVEGAFVPIYRKGPSGEAIVDKRKTVMIEGGLTTVKFNVMPFLQVRWVGSDPVTINPDKTATVKVKVTRGTEKPKFQAPVTDINLYVNRYTNVSENSYSTVLTKKLEFEGTEGNKKLGKILTLTTENPLTRHDIHIWFLRVGARTSYGEQKYNYTTPIRLELDY